MDMTVSPTYDVQTASSGLFGIVAGPPSDSGSLWFTETTAGKIGRITTAGVVTREYPLPTGMMPTAITVGQDGALWFIDANSGFGRITKAFSVTSYPSIFSGAYFYPTITQGPDGNLYGLGLYSAYYPYLVQIVVGQPTFNTGRAPSKTTPQAPYGDYSWPQQIAAGPDGAIWAAEWYGWITHWTPVNVRNGIDVSPGGGAPLPGAVRQMVQAGIKYAVVKASQTPDNNVGVGQLNAFSSGGIQTGIYCFIHFSTTAATGKVQADNCANRIANASVAPRFMALDVESENGVTLAKPVSARQKILDDAITETANKGFKVAIYTNSGDWNSLIDSTAYSKYPLWNSPQTSFVGYADPSGLYNCYSPLKQANASLVPQLHGGMGVLNIESPATDHCLFAFFGYPLVTIQAPNTFMPATGEYQQHESRVFMNGRTLNHPCRISFLICSSTRVFKHTDVPYIGDVGTASLVFCLRRMDLPNWSSIRLRSAFYLRAHAVRIRDAGRF